MTRAEFLVKLARVYRELLLFGTPEREQLFGKLLERAKLTPGELKQIRRMVCLIKNDYATSTIKKDLTEMGNRILSLY